MDLIRRICLEIEVLPLGVPLRGLMDVDEETSLRHAELLTQDGLVEGNVLRYQEGGGAALLRQLTWSGHDFADAVKNEGVWARAKSKILTSGASFTFELLKEFLKAEVAKGFPPLN